MKKTNTKFKINPTENFEHHINDFLSKDYFPRYKYHLSYWAKFTKLLKGEEQVFHKWVMSDFNYNHSNDYYSIHNTIIQNLDDEQLEGSGFQFQEKEEVILEIYKGNDIIVSSSVELPER